MVKFTVAWLVVLLLLLSHNRTVQAQTCTTEEEQRGNQLLALAEIYVQQRQWEKAAGLYAEAALSQCPAISSNALDRLDSTLAAEASLQTFIQENLRTIVLAVAGIVLIFLIAKIFVWYIDRTDKWIVVPFVDLSGNKAGDGIAESLVTKMHRVRLLYSNPPDVLFAFSERIDLPSFSVATQKKSLLSSLSALDSLDVIGINLPLGSALSSMIGWLDLGARRLVGSIQQYNNRLEISVRLEEGRGAKCTRIWKVSSELDAASNELDLTVMDELVYRILFDIAPGEWGTASVAALEAFTEGLEQLNSYYESRFRDKVALQHAKDRLAKAVQIDPAYYSAVYHLGIVNLNAGDYKQAIDLLASLLKQTEFQPELYYNLGVAHYQRALGWSRNKYRKAEEFFDRIVIGFSEERSNSEEDKKLLGLAYCGLTMIVAQRIRAKHSDPGQSFADGKAHYEKAVALASSIHDSEVYAQVQYSMGILHLMCGQYDQAFVLLEDALTHNPYHWRAYTALGQVALASGRHTDAISSLTKAILLSPDYEYAHYQLGQAYALSTLANKNELAIESFSKAPTISRAHLEMGRIIAERTGIHEDGIRHFRRAIELNSKLVDAHASLAWHLAEGSLLQGNGKVEALAAAKRAVKITKSMDWHKLAILGRIYYECHEYQKALTTLQRAKQINPTAPQVYYYLALVRITENADQEAKDLLISLLSLKNLGIWKHKAVTLMRTIDDKFSAGEKEQSHPLSQT
jgi:tetratricopeptide (TPR) repeat protein